MTNRVPETELKRKRGGARPGAGRPRALEHPAARAAAAQLPELWRTTDERVLVAGARVDWGGGPAIYGTACWPSGGGFNVLVAQPAPGTLLVASRPKGRHWGEALAWLHSRLGPVPDADRVRLWALFLCWATLPILEHAQALARAPAKAWTGKPMSSVPAARACVDAELARLFGLLGLEAPVLDGTALDRDAGSGAYSETGRLVSAFFAQGGDWCRNHVRGPRVPQCQRSDLEFKRGRDIGCRVRQSDDMHDYLTVEEVAERLRCSPRAVHRWVAKGKLPAVRPGRRLLIRSRDVEALLRPRPTSAVTRA